jgi:hypothetical protein
MMAATQIKVKFARLSSLSGLWSPLGVKHVVWNSSSCDLRKNLADSADFFFHLH